MNPLADASANALSLVRKLVIAGLVGGAIVAGGRYCLTLEPSSAELFQQANPGWSVVEADGRPPEERGSGGYLIDPHEGSGERQVAIAFYRWSDTTELVFTFRPMPTP